jgi:hypothetical protein
LSIVYRTTGEITIMAPKTKDKTTSANVVDTAVSPTPPTDNSKTVTIDSVSYDMTNLVDVVKLAVALNTMNDQQLQAYNAMRAGGIDDATIASLIGKGCQERGNMSPNHRFEMSPVHHTMCPLTTVP